MLDAQVGEAGAGGRASGPSREDGTNWNNTHGVFNGTGDLAPFYADSGGASRFFFVSEGVKWETNVHVVSDAGIRCASCGTVTALSPARASASPANSDRGQDSTDGSASSTQRQSLVSSAEDLDGTAITLTTPTYCGSCGCALPVTVALTNSASMGKAAAASDPATETRFRYDAKASRSEREAGLEAVEPAVVNTETPPGTAGANSPRAGARRNDHPTVKPVSVMAWLCRLVTPPGGVVLDPFLGSGTTAMAALDEGFRCIGIEREEGYIFKARLRVTHRHLLELQPVEAQPEIPQGRLF